jgi:hypothetical protein
MAYFDWGNKPIYSTQGIVSAPSTASIIGAIDSTVLGTASFRAGQSRHFRITAIIGCDTNAAWQVERTPSTALDAAVETVWIRTPNNQSGQYVFAMCFEKDQFLRARMVSTGANAACYLQAEPLT